MAHKPVICLVGGMGSGKSLVAAAFARRGGHLISGDLLGHEALRQPAIRDRVAARWGLAILDSAGEIDRRRLGGIVFAESCERHALEALVFPWIERRITEEITAAQANPAVVFIVLDAAIMLEAGWNQCCDRLVYVDAPRATRLQRLLEQRGWTEKEVQARESAQMPLSEKASRADDVVDNSGLPEEVDRQVADLLHRWAIPPGETSAPPGCRTE
jgi:dephospho-CoA kinase